MYAECVTGPRAVFNRKLEFTFVNKGGTFLLALSWKWGENIMRAVDHLQDCLTVRTTVLDQQCFKPGLGECCFLCHQNSEKVVKYMPFCYPNMLVGTPSTVPLQTTQEPNQSSIQWRVKLIVFPAQLYILPLLPTNGCVVGFVGLRMTKHFPLNVLALDLV